MQTVTIQEIAKALGKEHSTVWRRAIDEKWPYEAGQAKGRGQPPKLYHYKDLPEDVRKALKDLWEREAPSPEQLPGVGKEAAERWAGLEEKERRIALARKSILRACDGYLLRDKSKKRNKQILLREFYARLTEALKARKLEVLLDLGFTSDRALQVMEHVKKVSDKTDYKWRTAYTEAEEAFGLGVLGLVRKGWEAPGFGAKCLTADMIAYVRQLITKGQVKLKPIPVQPDERVVEVNRAGLYRRLCGKYGKDVVSYEHFCRWINLYLLENQKDLCAVCLPSFYMSQFALKAGTLSSDVTYAGERWESDGTPADLRFKGVRHDLVVAVDVYSRDIVYELQTHASAITVAKTYGKGIRRWGVPKKITSDRGSIFLAEHIRSGCEFFGIEMDVCDAYAPWQKGHVESAIGAMSRVLFEALPWYCGHNVGERKRIDEYDRFLEVFYHKRKDGEKEKISCDATAEEVRKVIDDWLEKVYRVEDHEFADLHTGRSPCVLTRLSESPKRAKKIIDPEALDLALGPRLVREFRSGIQWLHDQPYVPADADSWVKAAEFSRRKVIFRPSLSNVDLGGIWEMLPDGGTGPFICYVYTYGRGMSLEEYMKAKNHIEKEHKKRRAAIDTMCPPETYDRELAKMDVPKVVVANFGAVEFDGEAYQSMLDAERPAARKAGLSDIDRAEILRQVKEYDEQAHDGESEAPAREIPAVPRFSLVSKRLIEPKEPVVAEEPPTREMSEQSVPSTQAPGDSCIMTLDRIDAMSDPLGRYEKLMELEAKGHALSRRHQADMRYIEQSEIYEEHRDRLEMMRARFALQGLAGVDGKMDE